MELQDIAELLHHESTETTVKHYPTVNKKKIKENKDKFTFQYFDKDGIKEVKQGEYVKKSL